MHVEQKASLEYLTANWDAQTTEGRSCHFSSYAVAATVASIECVANQGFNWRELKWVDSVLVTRGPQPLKPWMAGRITPRIGMPEKAEDPLGTRRMLEGRIAYEADSPEAYAVTDLNFFFPLSEIARPIEWRDSDGNVLHRMVDTVLIREQMGFNATKLYARILSVPLQCGSMAAEGNLMLFLPTMTGVRGLHTMLQQLKEIDDWLSIPMHQASVNLSLPQIQNDHQDHNVSSTYGDSPFGEVLHHSLQYSTLPGVKAQHNIRLSIQNVLQDRRFPNKEMNMAKLPLQKTIVVNYPFFYAVHVEHQLVLTGIVRNIKI